MAKNSKKKGGNSEKDVHIIQIRVTPEFVEKIDKHWKSSFEHSSRTSYIISTIVKDLTEKHVI